MSNSRVFVHTGSQAGVFHVVSRVVDRTFRLGEREKDEIVRLMLLQMVVAIDGTAALGLTP